MSAPDPGVAAVLRELRGRSGLTLEQAANGIPCGHAWLAKVEAGTAAPSLALIHAASELYARAIKAGVGVTTTDTPDKTRLVLAVYEDELPKGFLGYSAPEGAVWIDPRQRPVKRAETLLHEIFHVLLGHDGPADEHVEWDVEQLCLETVRALQKIGPVVWEPVRTEPEKRAAAACQNTNR
ncbi:MAG: helix-turn-helix domain-containing protein [Cellulomonadaceae bacterium]